jgi:hypothetical protein
MLHRNAHRVVIDVVCPKPVANWKAEDFFGEDPRVVAARPENQRRLYWASASDQIAIGMAVCAALLMWWLLLPAQLRSSLVNMVTRRSRRNRPSGLPAGNGIFACCPTSPSAIHTPGGLPGTLQHIQQGAGGNDAAPPRG